MGEEATAEEVEERAEEVAKAEEGIIKGLEEVATAERGKAKEEEGVGLRVAVEGCEGVAGSVEGTDFDWVVGVGSGQAAEVGDGQMARVDYGGEGVGVGSERAEEIGIEWAEG